jgi:hypothetical protein
MNGIEARAQFTAFLNSSKDKEGEQRSGSNN